MSIRAVILGLLLGLSVSAVAYYNDFVIVQVPLINHLLPIIILGSLLAILMLVNPLLSLFGSRGFNSGEVAVVAAIGLAACAYPEAGFYRTGPTNVVVPAYDYPTKSHWQSHHVLAYVPGGPAHLGEGHVQDWPALNRRLVEAGEQAPGSVLGLLWRELPLQIQLDFQRAAELNHLSPDQRRALTRALNQGLDHARLYQADNLASLELPEAVRAQAAEARTDPPRGYRLLALNRSLLVGTLPNIVLPPPAGDGAMLLGGQTDPRVTDPLMHGLPGDVHLGVTELPWRAWWPVIRLWGGSALLIGLASLCLALVVHPQWSRNELLPYPIARFVTEVAHRAPGRVIPQVMLSPLFWWGFGGMLVLHGIRGMQLWLPEWPIPEIPARLDFMPLRELFPNASRVEGVNFAYFHPFFFFTVLAFAFFLPAQVSFSMGIAPLLFILLAVTMMQFGLVLEADYLAAGHSNMLRFGAYLGIAAMIVYTGRRYYASVVAGAVGLRTAATTPRSAIWAARGAVLASFAAAAVLTTGGLHWSFALAAVLLILLILVVLARIVAETGMFFIQPYWMPVAVLTVFLGFEALGPTTYILLALASTMIVGDTRTALMGNVVNALQIVDRSGVKPARTAPWMVMMVVTGFLVAGTASLYVAYNLDAFSRVDGWSKDVLTALPFDELAGHLAEASATNRLADATALSGGQGWLAASPDTLLVGWAAIGLALVLLTSVARLRLPWWPLHPVAFLIWGTYPADRFAFTFLLGWLVKLGVMKLGGTRSYRTLVPLMVGLIGGEVTIALFWLGVGTVYYMNTGLDPKWPAIF